MTIGPFGKPHAREVTEEGTPKTPDQMVSEEQKSHPGMCVAE